MSRDKSLGSDGALTFDRVLSDPRVTFTPLLGTFTCPDNSTYAFYWTIQAVLGRVATMLVKDGVDMKYGPLTSEIPGETWGSSSMAAIMRCSQGAQVWLRAVSWPDNMACNSILRDYSSFSAFKLYEDEERMASGFTAHMSANTTSDGGTLVFDEEVVDLGNDYNPGNGAFTVPESGVYVFTVSIHVASSNIDYMYISVNGFFRVVLLYAINTNSLNTDSGTSTITRLLDCRAGDVVTVHYASTQTYLAGVTSITGYRLFNPNAPQDIVAFHASLSDDTEVISGNTVVFNSVSLNLGSYYFPAYGIFVCPDSALYFLTWAVTVTDENLQRAGEARLMMSDAVKKVGPQTSRVLNASFNKSCTSSTQTVIQCEPQKAVSVQAVVSDANKATLFGNRNNFAGFRLPPI